MTDDIDSGLGREDPVNFKEVDVELARIYGKAGNMKVWSCLEAAGVYHILSLVNGFGEITGCKFES